MSRQKQQPAATHTGPTDGDAALQRAVLWGAASFLGVALAGLLFAPSLGPLWVGILVFGLAAVPAAFRRAR